MSALARGLLTTLAVCQCLYCTVSAQTAKLAATPPMGWNSWNHFAKEISDPIVRVQADAMVSSGMGDAGYIDINIDDTWEGERNAKGFIHSNSKFPDMKALANYIHGKGLKVGIYSSPAIFAWTACFLITILVSLFTRAHPESRLSGLVYSLTARAQTEGLPWHERPGILALVVLVMALILNLIVM